MGWPDRVGQDECPDDLAAVSSEPQAAGDDLVGQVAETQIVTERVGPQPDQRFCDTDVELGCHHARLWTTRRKSAPASNSTHGPLR
jgi:hypothetical protein